MRLPRSLRARVALAAVGALALSLLLAGALLVIAVERSGRGAVDHELRERAQRVVGGAGPQGAGAERAGHGAGAESRRGSGGGLQGPGGPGGPGDPGRGRGGGPGGPRGPGGPGGPDRGLLAGSGSFVRVLFGNEVVDQGGDVPRDPAPIPSETGFSTLTLDRDPWRVLTVAASGRGQRVQFFQSLAGVQQRVADTRRLVAVVGLVALAVTALAAFFATSAILRPLARLRGAAAGVSGTEDLRQRLPRGRDDPEEVAAMTASLNAMLARLEASADATERALAATRRFAADAGHELRTPMTGLGANLDALLRNPDLSEPERRQALEEMHSEQRRMVALLEGLQALARGDAAEGVPRERVEVADVADAAVAAARRRHPRVSFELDDAAAGDGVVEGWPDGLRMLIDNLLDNAAIHGRPDGHVVARVSRDGNGTVRIVVDDDGPGLSPHERGRVLAPFARGTGVTAPGTGLGLALVAQQAAIHGGEIELAEADGGGLRAGVRLPSSATGN